MPSLSDDAKKSCILLFILLGMPLYCILNVSIVAIFNMR